MIVNEEIINHQLSTSAKDGLYGHKGRDIGNNKILLDVLNRYYDIPAHKIYCSYYLIEGVKIEINIENFDTIEDIIEFVEKRYKKLNKFKHKIVNGIYFITNEACKLNLKITILNNTQIECELLHIENKNFDYIIFYNITKEPIPWKGKEIFTFKSKKKLLNWMVSL